MALPYRLFYVANVNGFSWQPVSCDLAPVWTVKQRYSATYRDLPGAGITQIPAEVTLAQTNLSGGPPPSAAAGVYVAATMGAGQSLSDDVSHTPFRQDQPHSEDWLVFTDSLGTLCGEFSGLEWDSWNNTGPPNFQPTVPATAPH